MTGKNWLIVGVVGAGVFLLLKAQAANAGNFTTEGKQIYFQERDGRIYDQYGGLWT